MLNLTEVTNKARAILKSLKEPKKDEEEKTSPIPEPPPDPDGLEKDPRVGDASPQKEDLEEAGKSATPPPEASAPEGGGESLDEEGDEDERPVAKSFTDDELEMLEMDPRELLKSYADETLMPPPEAVQKGGDDLAAILNDILDQLKNENAVQTELQAEVKRLREGLTKNERTINKALECLADPRVAPAAPPKAITKSFPEAPAMDRTALADAIYQQGMAGQMTVDQAKAACLTGRIDA